MAAAAAVWPQEAWVEVPVVLACLAVLLVLLPS
jgi:hypothetical protein